MTNGATNVIKRADVTVEYPVTADTKVNAGRWVVITSGYAIENNAKEGITVVGIAMTTVDNSDGAAGAKYVAVMKVGIATLECLVQDTNASSGFDAAITSGMPLFIGGDGTDDGQYVVSGAGTDTSSIVGVKCVGEAIGAEAGSTSADTVGSIDVYVNMHGGV